MKKDFCDWGVMIGAVLTGVGTIIIGIAALVALPKAGQDVLTAVRENRDMFLEIKHNIEELKSLNAKLDIKLNWQDPKGREFLLEKYNLKLDQSKLEEFKALSPPDAENKIYNMLQ